MRRSISRAILAGAAALAMSATIFSTTTPASAFHGGVGGFRIGGFGGFHPGFGGFRRGFGGFRPAGFVGVHPGFRNGFVAFHPGHRPFFPGRRIFFHPGFFRNGVWINGWWGPAVVAGAWWGASSYGCWTYQPVYDAWGRFLGQSYVNVCT